MATSAFAQSGADDRALLARRGAARMVAGAMTIAIGLAVAGSGDGWSAKSAAPIAGFSVVGGGALMYLGAKDRQAASRPQTRIGVTLGRTRGIAIQHRW